ncbi:MAG: Holliday junction branch migration protein RuvA [Planctomycetes bacterium]|nr:Holliday junction branch migration protein RuvA [Planctomycetota bacterium]
MYEFFEGRIVQLELHRAIVDVQGIGYILQISSHSMAKLRPGQTTRILSHLVVVDGEPRLYGFADATERDLFRMLTSVSGVGPATALGLLSQMNPSQVARALASGDETTLRQAKGIGAKTAGRLIVELREAAQKLGFVESESSPAENDAMQALTALGFSRPEAQRLMEMARKTNPGGSSEVLVKSALAASRSKS